MKEIRSNIGGIGENYCAMLCSQAGLLANPSSSNDATGWDYIVEFPDTLLDGPSSTEELHEGAPQCRIQVKTSVGRKTYDDVTLSNLIRMATDPLPAFFLFVGVSIEGDVIATYLVMMDNSLITKVLKRKRQLDIGPLEQRRLNRRKMRVKATDGMELQHSDPAAFLISLTQSIGSFSDSLKAKRLHLETTGFENGNASLTIEPVSGDIDDLMLGRISRLELKRFSSTPTRFGIGDPQPAFAHEGGGLKYPTLIRRRQKFNFEHHRSRRRLYQSLECTELLAGLKQIRKDIVCALWALFSIMNLIR